MIAFVPDQMLEHEDRMVVMHSHFVARLDLVLYGNTHNIGTFVQHFGDAHWVTLGLPFVVGWRPRKLRRILMRKNEPTIMDMRKEFPNLCAFLQRPRFQS